MKGQISSLKGVVQILLGVSMLVAFILLGNYNWQKAEKQESEKFSEVYPNVGKDNVFVYKRLKEINQILTKESGIIFLGFPACIWCQSYVQYVNEVAKEMQIDKIYYYDIYHDRNNLSPDYQQTVKILGDMLPINDNNERRIYVPNLTVVKDGKIVFNDNETATIFSTVENPTEEYWTDEKVEDFKNKLKNAFKDFSPICTDCNN